MDNKGMVSAKQPENAVRIQRRGMLSLVSCVISNSDGQQPRLQQSSRCVWPLSAKNSSNILSRRVYGKGW